jgi:hypothetical protein
MHQQAAGGARTDRPHRAESRGGLTFSEVMAGPFALGPAAPLLSGSRSTGEIRLTLRASLTIPDVARFVADPEHRGALTATIAVGDRMNDVPACGWFKLFAPAGDPTLKLMIYRARFDHEGVPYTFHGVKEVGRRSVLRAWTETTTLNSRLHRGTDEQAPVCGAGTLRLTPGGFARQLLSFRPVDGTSASARVRAVSAFLLFFARELVDSYLSGRPRVDRRS